jgi:hypothetical protein
MLFRLFLRPEGVAKTRNERVNEVMERSDHARKVRFMVKKWNNGVFPFVP